LLLFNTNENPYKKYKMGNNLEYTNRRLREKMDENIITEAPKTVKEGDELPINSQENVTYRPVLGSVPQINLPNALPLSMVATDGFSYQGESQVFAPSALHEILPDIEDDTPLPTPTNPSNNSMPNNSQPPPPFDNSMPPPPPPSFDNSMPPPPPPPMMDGPPPPMMDAPPPPTMDFPPSSNDIDEPPPISDGGDDIQTRSSSVDSSTLSFAEQIALKKGQGLKKVIKNDDDPKLASASPGSILGDLVSALMRRRKGMGGKTVGTEKKKKDDDEDVPLPLPLDQQDDIPDPNKNIKHDEKDWDP